MIDIHTHILPGLDDGSSSVEDTIAMAKAAVSEGITAMVATPHHGNDYFDNEAASIQDAVGQMNRILQQHYIPLTIMPGQEARISSRFIDDFHAQRIQPLNQTCYILIEFPSQHIPDNIENIFHELHVKGKVPIIAHPERNREIIAHPDRLVTLCRMGALTQVTSHSINGRFGKKLQRFAIDLCRRQLVHFVASDVHNLTFRPFHLAQAYEVIEHYLDSDTSKQLQSNAEQLIQGATLSLPDPEPWGKKVYAWKSWLNY